MQVIIENTLGIRRMKADLPPTAPMQILLQALIPQLHWPVLNRQNEPNRYRVYHNSREILDDQTLQEVGVQEGDTLTIIPETPAGGIHYSPGKE